MHDSTTLTDRSTPPRHKYCNRDRFYRILDRPIFGYLHLEYLQCSSIEVTGDVDEFDHELRRNTRSLTMPDSHVAQYNNTTHLARNIRCNFTEYSRIIAESFAKGRSVYVTITDDRTGPAIRTGY